MNLSGDYLFVESYETVVVGRFQPPFKKKFYVEPHIQYLLFIRIKRYTMLFDRADSCVVTVITQGSAHATL